MAAQLQVRDVSTHDGPALLDTAASDMAAYKAYILPTADVNPILKQLQLAYYRYKVTFGLYVMTSGEIALLNTIVLLCVALVSFAVFFYMPRFTMRLARRVAFYYWGPSTTEGVMSTVRTIIRSTSAYTAAATSSNMTAPMTTRLEL